MESAEETVFLIHYHEIGLKGKNRGRFENQLVRNIKKALGDVPRGSIRRISGRLLLETVPETPSGVVRDRLAGVFGIANFSEAILVAPELDKIREAAWALAEKSTFETFKIAARRGDKTLPFTSNDLNHEVGAHVQALSKARVQMNDPDMTCHIEVAPQSALVYAEKVSGPGGLPVGVNEKAVSLLSSGIDSPVASYRIMKRGVHLDFVHFHSVPYTNRASQRNVESLLRLLNQFQYRSRLFLVPFAEIQRHIMTEAIISYRVILYRRSMFRIAERIGLREGAAALVTGENVGQVASQTLSNIRAIEEVTSLPVLRPLAGDNKEEIIQAAKEIGTYEISIEPYEDACTLFVPKHPETRADLDTVNKIESRLDLEPLIEETLEKTEIRQFSV